MPPCERGAVRNREAAEQGRDFTGLRFGTISPTDIDGFIDFGNQCFVLIETKHVGADLPKGQRLALERLVDACEDAGKRSLLIIAGHETPFDEQIDVARCLVREYRTRKQPRSGPVPRCTVRKLIDLFLAHEELPTEYLAPGILQNDGQYRIDFG
jgi:hypothetical protein